MIAIVVEHVILSTGIVLCELIDYLGKAVVHNGDLPKVYFPDENVISSFRFKLQNT